MNNRVETEPDSLILVVEDNIGDVRLVREGVESADDTVKLEVLKSGGKAIDRVSATDGAKGAQGGPDGEIPALVFLDLNLPGASGFDVLEVLRANERFETVPVVVVSSSQNPEDVTRAYDATANAYVTKPTDPDEYIEMIATATEFWIPDSSSPKND